MLKGLLVFVSVLFSELVVLRTFAILKQRMRKDFERNMNNDNMFAMADFAQELHELACEDLNIDPDITISIYEENDLSLGSTCIDHKNRRAYKIIVNPNQRVEQFIETVLHETRHVYQSIVTPEVIFDRDSAYVGVDDTDEDFDTAYQKYAEQDIEVDARLYAETAMKLYKRRINKMVKQYTKDINR